MATQIKSFETQEIIVLVDKSGNVPLVALDIPHLRADILRDYPDCNPVTGDLAHVLYKVLTGHSFLDEQPSPTPMRNSRNAMRTMFTLVNNPQFSVALRALAAMDNLRPMLGKTQFDDAGRIISPTPPTVQRENSVPRARTHVHARVSV